MTALLSEFKIILVIAGVLAVTLSVARWRQAQDAPIYLPAADPYLYGRVCSSACPGPTSVVPDGASEASLDAEEPQR